MGRIWTVCVVLVLIAGCSPEERAGEKAAGEAVELQNVLTLHAVGMRFEGPPGEVASGWTTIRLQNDSDLTHFALIEQLPEGVTAMQLFKEAGAMFQQGLNLSIAGDADGAAKIFANLPPYVSDIVYLGGPGLVAGGRTAEATVFLKPGNYTIECYVKTNGVLHQYNPDPNALGMVLPLTVTEEKSPDERPEANVFVSISSAGYEITKGAFHAGRNVVRADFLDQRAYGFIGHDLHIFKVDADTDLAKVSEWMDVGQPHGLETPAPATFVGGTNDMPSGSTTYFTLDLEAGDYAMIAEIPDPAGKGLLMRFSVAE